MAKPVLAVDCVPHAGRESSYQSKAAEVLFREESKTVNAWDWITSDCGTSLCLFVDHLIVNTPQRLAFPRAVCIYCGDPGFTMDHLLPRSSTGDAKRKFVLTVPACGQCNSFIGDYPDANITRRREVAHERIRKRYHQRLQTRDWTSAELREFGPMMRRHVKAAMAEKGRVLERLSWPHDPEFDIRAIERSGIEDPYQTGLLGRSIDPIHLIPTQRPKVSARFLPGDAFELMSGLGAGKKVRLESRVKSGKWIARIIAHPDLPNAVGTETYLADAVLQEKWRPLGVAA